VNCPSCHYPPPSHRISCALIWTLPAARTGLQPCGSFAAYQRHMRNREAVCGPCRDASLWHGRAQAAMRRIAARRPLIPVVLQKKGR